MIPWYIIPQGDPRKIPPASLIPVPRRFEKTKENSGSYYLWWQPEIRNPAPVEGTVVEIPLFTRVLAPSQVVGNGISEASTVELGQMNILKPFLVRWRWMGFPSFSDKIKGWLIVLVNHVPLILRRCFFKKQNIYPCINPLWVNDGCKVVYYPSLKLTRKTFWKSTVGSDENSFWGKRPVSGGDMLALVHPTIHVSIYVSIHPSNHPVWWKHLSILDDVLWIVTIIAQRLLTSRVNHQLLASKYLLHWITDLKHHRPGDSEWLFDALVGGHLTI